MDEDVRAMNRTLLLCLLMSAALHAQTVPQATDLPSHPFFIKATWYIGGAGNWDYLTMDPQADRLYIAHGTSVQVVDVDSGTQVGEITGFYEARQIALDDTGQFGFVSDGGQGKVVVFDRQTLKRVAEIDTGPNPRSLVYDSNTKLLFAVRANPPDDVPGAAANGKRPAAKEEPPAEHETQSHDTQSHDTHSIVTVIDTASNTAIGEIALPGLLGFAVGDQNDQIYVAVTDRNQVVRFDAQAVASLLRPAQAEGAAPAAAKAGSASGSAKPSVAPWVSLDWTGLDRTGRQHPQSAAEGHLALFNLSPECADPTSLAIDSAHMRLFAACNNRRLVVLNAGTGDKITSLPIGPGVEAVGYDNERGLLFTANGGAEGSMTVIRQDVTDSYAVTQTLPTRQRASTLAVNPETGAIYLVTDYLGVNLDRPGGIGTLEQTPVKGSFQVLQISN
jgi:DNA-binding beta-propeller fold protein YncE